MKNRLLSILVSSAPILCAAAVPVTRSPEEIVRAVDELAAKELDKPGGAGLSIAVAQRGKILLERGYGIADAEFEVNADQETMFRIGSVTKQMTAALLMRLVEQKKIALDDDLSKYVPEFPLQGRKVTIEQLLNHTSGIKSYTDLGEEWEKLWPNELKHEQLLALVKDSPFDFEPGTGWHYNNTGYYLLGMVIEKVTGKSYADAMQTELFTPLGLERTRYDSNRDVIKNRAQGYALDGDRLVNDIPLGMSQPGAAGGIVSTAGDLVRWQMALTSGKVVTPESFARMKTSTMLPSGRDTHYGFGLQIGEWEGRARVEHGGGIFGFNSKLSWIPGDDLHIAVISNGERISSDKLAEAIAYVVLDVQRAAVKDDPIPADVITKLSGDYVFDVIGLEAKVFENGEQLMVQGNGQGAFRVLWQGELEFRAEFDPQVRFVFAADGKSVQLHQNGRMVDGVRK